MKKLRKKHAELNEECRVLKQRAPEEEPPTDLEARLAQLDEIHEQATRYWAWGGRFRRQRGLSISVVCKSQLET